MFFSIIIPCYNCKNTIDRLLKSILIQDLNKDDYEVICIDDHSTDGFNESSIELYKPFMNISYHMRSDEDYKEHCPGNTRREGLKYATGDWVGFIDCDDMFEVINNSLKRVMDELIALNNPEIKLYYSKFQKWDSTNTICLNNNLWHPTWLHGNFYNRQFLIDNNINFKTDLIGNEDLYFENLTLGHIFGQKLSYYYQEEYNVYRWIENPNSFSKAINNYLIKFFKDYIYANSEPYFICYKFYPESRDYFINQRSATICYCYFYTQSVMYDNVTNNMNQEEVKELLLRFMKEFDLSLEDIIIYIYSNMKLYKETRASMVEASREGKDFIEFTSLKDYLISIVNME